MISCPACRTLNADQEPACLSCGASLTAAAATSCPQGHPIDPSWASCPYCALPGAAAPAPRPITPPDVAARRTQLFSTPVVSGPPQRPPQPVADRPPSGIAPTRLLPVAPAREMGTRLAGIERPMVPAATQQLAEPVRDLVAVLAALGLGPGGSVFPLRTGKNFLGAAPHQEIRLCGDPRVSAEHAVILVRGGRLYLSDRLSTNGTWVDGREVDAGGSVELHDRQVLRLGDTELVLLVLPSRSPEGT